MPIGDQDYKTGVARFRGVFNEQMDEAADLRGQIRDLEACLAEAMMAKETAEAALALVPIPTPEVATRTSTTADWAVGTFADKSGTSQVTGSCPLCEDSARRVVDAYADRATLAEALRQVEADAAAIRLAFDDLLGAESFQDWWLQRVANVRSALAPGAGKALLARLERAEGVIAALRALGRTETDLGTYSQTVAEILAELEAPE